MHPEARAMVEALGLKPHPEGGFYRETFRASAQVQSPLHGGARNASTAIYFLLPAGTFSALHRILGSDEVWHFYAGDPLELYLLETAAARSIRLGPHLASGDVPQAVVPAGAFPAATAPGPRYTLFRFTVSSGFYLSGLC